MAHPIFKPENNVNYDATMLGGPYAPDGGKGPVPPKESGWGQQWKYLVRIGETPQYWYATDRTNEMIEKRGYNNPSSPFTILKRVDDGRNKGFELSGETYDDIFPKEQSEQPPPTSLTAGEEPEQQAPSGSPGHAADPLTELEARMVTFSQAVNERLHDIEKKQKANSGQIDLLVKHTDCIPF